MPSWRAAWRARILNKVLALDVGTVRVGVAVSDPSRTIAQPLQVLQRRRRPHPLIAQLVAEHEVGQIVVGRPLTLSGVAGPAVRATEAFVAELGPFIQIPIVWWDERLTTVAAERAMLEGNVRRQDRRQSIDKVAAALLLQSYLDAQGRPQLS